MTEFKCPPGWKIIDRWGEGFCLIETGGGLRVIIDWDRELDGHKWCHVSYSRRDWTPTHEDTCKVKAAFIGDRYAYAVFPPVSSYVNIHAHCLHLWARLDEGDGRILPEFSSELPLIGRSI